MPQVSLKKFLDFGWIAGLIEIESIHKNDAFGLLNMMRDLRQGIFSELRTGKSIDTYRRNLQRAYIDRMEFLMTKDQSQIPAAFRRFVKRTNVNVNQSDIRAIVRAELKTLQRSIRTAAANSSGMKRIHLQDALVRINDILDPKS